MSDQITTAFVQQYGQNVAMLVQQKGSVLRMSVVNARVRGKRAYFDQLGSTAAIKQTTRHADSPLVATPHSRRSVDLSTFRWGDLIDVPDKIRTLIDPTSAYAQNAAWAMGRSIDDEIIAAFFAAANTGETGATSTSLPAGNVVAVNFGGSNTGLTVAKLREARRLLKTGLVDTSEPLFIGVNAKSMDYLLGTTEVTSADFNTVRALVQGEVNTFMGFKFLSSERFLTDSNAYRRVPVWAKSGMQLAMGMEPKSRITERADKAFSTYVYYAMDIGSTRLEEPKVIEIKVDETV